MLDDSMIDADPPRFDPVPAPPSTPTPGRPGDFGFLDGQWRIRHLKRRGDTWDRFEGDARCWSILDGIGHVEELMIPARDFSGLGLRLLDRAQRQWSDHWVNAKSGGRHDAWPDRQLRKRGPGSSPPATRTRARPCSRWASGTASVPASAVGGRSTPPTAARPGRTIGSCTGGAWADRHAPARVAQGASRGRVRRLTPTTPRCSFRILKPLQQRREVAVGVLRSHPLAGLQVEILHAVVGIGEDHHGDGFALRAQSRQHRQRRLGRRLDVPCRPPATAWESPVVRASAPGRRRAGRSAGTSAAPRAWPGPNPSAASGPASSAAGRPRRTKAGPRARSRRCSKSLQSLNWSLAQLMERRVQHFELGHRGVIDTLCLQLQRRLEAVFIGHRHRQARSRSRRT